MLDTENAGAPAERNDSRKKKPPTGVLGATPVSSAPDHNLDTVEYLLLHATRSLTPLGSDLLDVPDMMFVGEAIQGLAGFWIALISQFAIAMDGVVAAPSQLVAHRFAAARNAFGKPPCFTLRSSVGWPPKLARA